MTGRVWVKLSGAFQFGYLKGCDDANRAFVSNEKSSTDLSLTFADAIDALDSFYAEDANLPIPVMDARILNRRKREKQLQGLDGGLRNSANANQAAPASGSYRKADRSRCGPRSRTLCLARDRKGGGSTRKAPAQDRGTVD